MKRLNFLSLWILCILLLLGIALTPLFLLSSFNPSHDDSQYIDPDTPVQPEFMLVMTSHKTGTVLTGCLMEAVQHVMEAHSCNQGSSKIQLPIKCINDHVIFDTAYFRHRHVSRSGAKARVRNYHGHDRAPMDVGLSTGSTAQGHPPSAFPSPSSQHLPLAIFRTGYPPDITCLDQEASTQCDQLGAAGGIRIRPSMLRMGCPCTRGSLNCSSVGRCHFTRDRSRSWGTVTGRMSAFLVVRRPIDVILSAYSYHKQEPPVEQWLKEDKFQSYVKLFEISGGFSKDLVVAIKGHALKHHNSSYHDYLVGQSESKGLIAEFMHSSMALWQLARAKALSRASGIRVVRYEDLIKDPIETLTPFLLSSLSPCLNATLINSTLKEEAKACSVNTWSSEQIANNSHVTHNASVNRQRAALLLESPFIAAEIRRLNRALGYED